MKGQKQKVAMYWEKNDNGTVHCFLCPHNCVIVQDKTGLCGVRKNVEGTLYSLNWGHISSLALDPIEKKPLIKFNPGSMILSAGSVGCNLACPFCQNHTIARETMETVKTTYKTPKELADDAAAMKNRGNIGIAYTYNEPTVWFEFVLETSKIAHERGLKNVLVTNGYISKEPLEELLPYVDAMNIDLKAFDPRFYKEVVHGGLADVKATIAVCVKKCHVEVTTLVIPGLNDSAEQIQKMAEWLACISPDMPLHLSRFFPKYQMTDKKPTSRQTLQELAIVAQGFLKNVYIGNL
ncbi:MAG: AmmeMemoRadiSam system radical SAM enzyme [Eubacteriales bacterium]